MNELVIVKERRGSRRAVAVGAAGFVVGLCLGLAGCGVPPEEETEGSSTEQALMACSKCNAATCTQQCTEDPAAPDDKSVSCSKYVPSCKDDFGENENPENIRNPPGAGGGGAPKQHCSAVGQRGCVRSGNRVLVGQHTVSRCSKKLTLRGFQLQCHNEVYDTYSWQKASGQCEYCNCETQVVKRCNRGSLNGGNWGHRTCGTFGGGVDRARCS